MNNKTQEHRSSNSNNFSLNTGDYSWQEWLRATLMADSYKAVDQFDKLVVSAFRREEIRQKCFTALYEEAHSRIEKNLELRVKERKKYSADSISNDNKVILDAVNSIEISPQMILKLVMNDFDREYLASISYYSPARYEMRFLDDLDDGEPRHVNMLE